MPVCGKILCKKLPIYRVEVGDEITYYCSKHGHNEVVKLARRVLNGEKLTFNVRFVKDGTF